MVPQELPTFLTQPKLVYQGGFVRTEAIDVQRLQQIPC